MKKIICIILALVAVVAMLSAFKLADHPSSKTQNSQPTTAQGEEVPTTNSILKPTTTPATQSTTVPTQPEDPGVELEAQADCSVSPYPYPKHEGWPKIISSVEELEELANSDIGHTLNYVPKMIERYDDSFFEEHTLLLVYLYTYPVTKNYQVSSCFKMADGSYSIVLYGERPAWGDCANMPRYIVTFIAIKDHMPKDAVIQFTFLDEDTKLITN